MRCNNTTTRVREETQKCCFTSQEVMGASSLVPEGQEHALALTPQSEDVSRAKRRVWPQRKADTKAGSSFLQGPLFFISCGIQITEPAAPYLPPVTTPSELSGAV